MSHLCMPQHVPFYTTSPVRNTAERRRGRENKPSKYEKIRVSYMLPAHYYFATVDHWCDHNPMEDDEAECACAYCYTILPSRTERIAHETSSHQPWRCDICDMCFPTGPIFEEHQKGHRMFACELCEYRCKTKAMLRQHVATHSNEKNYKCAICSKAFKTPEYLAKHRRRHERIRPYKFPCPHCVRALRTRPGLIQHMEKVHAVQSTYACAFCGKTFDTAAYLSKHERRHAKDKAIPCPKCDMICKNPWTLRKHRAAVHRVPKTPDHAAAN
jgi:uncharacterized Zn-finger protein